MGEITFPGSYPPSSNIGIHGRENESMKGAWGDRHLTGKTG